MSLNTNAAGEWETVPASISAAGADVIAQDVHVLEIHLINGSGSAATVTITDKQSIPQPVVPPAISIPAGTDMIWEFTGRYAPGGIYWSASVDAAIVGYIRGRR